MFMNSELFSIPLSFNFFIFSSQVIFTIVFDIEKCGWDRNGAFLCTSIKLYACFSDVVDYTRWKYDELKENAFRG